MRNPIRRNKKIGLTQGGRVKWGAPMEKWSRLFARSTWEALSEQGEELRVIRENPSKAYVHPASPSQVLAVLDQLPSELTEDIRVIVLRRLPKEDEQESVEARKRYRCIILNAFPRDLRMVWKVKPTQADVRHMSRWCDRWTKKGGEWILQWMMQEIREYYLYHLLLHEVGHFHHGCCVSRRRGENFAEDFALEWEKKLKAPPSKTPKSTSRKPGLGA